VAALIIGVTGLLVMIWLIVILAAACRRKRLDSNVPECRHVQLTWIRVDVACRRQAAEGRGLD
jgi:hypothetical protein